ncbi:MAG: hypothetical protein WDO19_17275 [Bacteroidota bacterium]
MQLSHPDYIILVIEAYKKRLKDNELSPLLATLTRANIRQECLNVYTERIKKGEKEETNTLRAFFGVPPAGKNFGYLIEKCNLDKFRPLESLIKKRINNPGMANIELLAWLIDFRLRPYVFGMDVILNDEELAILGKRIDDPDNNKESKSKDTKSSLKNETEKNELPNRKDFNLPPLAVSIKKNKLRMASVIFLIAAICLGSMYIIWQLEGPKQMVLGNVNTGCMYWAGDHYEEMPCNEERKDRLKLPMDLEKMKGFKRIMREDTITEKSIGKVYYIRINGTREYYTAGGNHPVDVTRTLHQLTTYIFDKYLNKREIPKKAL